MKYLLITRPLYDKKYLNLHGRRYCCFDHRIGIFFVIMREWNEIEGNAFISDRDWY